MYWVKTKPFHTNLKTEIFVVSIYCTHPWQYHSQRHNTDPQQKKQR